MFKGNDEHHFILEELFWKVCLGQRKFNSIFILLILESVVIEARYHMKGIHFAGAPLTWESRSAGNLYICAEVPLWSLVFQYAC